MRTKWMKREQEARLVLEGILTPTMKITVNLNPRARQHVHQKEESQNADGWTLHQNPNQNTKTNRGQGVFEGAGESRARLLENMYQLPNDLSAFSTQIQLERNGRKI